MENIKEKIYPCLRTGIKALLFLMLFPRASSGQDFDFQKLNLHVRNDTLLVDVYFSGLFEGEIRKTMLAGIPVQLDLILKISNQENSVIFSRNLSSLISYDVWDEEFQVNTYLKGKKVFTEFSEIKDYFTPLKNLVVSDIDNLHVAGPVTFSVEAMADILTEKESSKLKKWLEKGDVTEEENPTGERDTGFKLDLSRLVSFFFGNRAKTGVFTARATMTNINLKELAGRP